MSSLRAYATPTEQQRDFLVQRELEKALARIERWHADIGRNFIPPRDEMEKAIIDIRNTLQEIQS